MTKSLALCALSAALLAATAASAQMYPGQGISVNPNAAYGRPSGPNGPYAGVIHLHMPAPHKRHVAKKAAPSAADVNTALNEAQPPAPEPSAMPDVSQSTPEQTASTPPHKPKKAKKVEVLAPTPQQAASRETAPEDDGGIPLSLAPEESHPVAQPKPHKQTKTASTAPAPATAAPSTTSAVVAAQTPGTKSNLSKRSEILFPRGATDPGTETINELRGVASELNTLLGRAGARVQLEAYGGARGDKSSDARRLSLKRALVIRQILIEDGVPSERIDVRAMGGIEDSGAPDRVDVFVNAG
jgi:outer membrane protein OmpA-like peptidoglycan-associated protein